MKRLASALFLITRRFADGFRLFATGLVLAAVLRAMPRVDELSRGVVSVGRSSLRDADHVGRCSWASRRSPTRITAE